MTPLRLGLVTMPKYSFQRQPFASGRLRTSFAWTVKDVRDMVISRRLGSYVLLLGSFQENWQPRIALKIEHGRTQQARQSTARLDLGARMYKDK